MIFNDRRSLTENSTKLNGFSNEYIGFDKRLKQGGNTCYLKGCLTSPLGILANATLMRPNTAKTAVPGGHIARIIRHTVMATPRDWCKLESTLLLAIFFPPLSCTLGPLTVKRVGNPVFLYENHWSQGVKCYFEGRPRPQITWYKKGSNLKTFNHTEVETLQDNGIFKVTTTLHVPGRKEFKGIYSCFGNNSLSSGWSSSKEPKYGIDLFFRCEQSLSSPVANNWQFKKGRRQRQRLGQRQKSLLWLVERRINNCAARTARIEVCQTRFWRQREPVALNFSFSRTKLGIRRWINFVPGLRRFNTRLALITFPGIRIMHTSRTWCNYFLRLKWWQR